MSTNEWVIVPGTPGDDLSGLKVLQFGTSISVQQVNNTRVFSMIVRGRISMGLILVGLVVPYNIPGVPLQLVLPEIFIRGQDLNQVYAAGNPLTRAFVPRSVTEMNYMLDELKRQSSSLLTLETGLALIPGLPKTTLSGLDSPLDAILTLGITELSFEMQPNLRDIVSATFTIVNSRPFVFGRKLSIPFTGLNIQVMKTAGVFTFKGNFKGIARIGRAIVGVDIPYNVPGQLCNILLPELEINGKSLDKLLENAGLPEDVPSQQIIDVATANSLSLGNVVSAFPGLD
ncbi:MAG: hypothetical protein ACOVRM_19090, partial [Planctomycetaceae bacterium]